MVKIIAGAILAGLGGGAWSLYDARNASRIPLAPRPAHVVHSPAGSAHP